jgi:hypothetical protein
MEPISLPDELDEPASCEALSPWAALLANAALSASKRILAVRPGI